MSENLDHGLYYVSRNGTTLRLDVHEFPAVTRPDRDVLAALLQYALEGLEQQRYPLLTLQPKAVEA